MANSILNFDRACPVIFDPKQKSGCPDGYDPYIFRPMSNANKGVFTPCCKARDCSTGDCVSQAETLWTKRVVKFFNMAQKLIVEINSDIQTIEHLTKTNQDALNSYFGSNPAAHEQATAQLVDYNRYATVVVNDLNHCLSIMGTLVDNKSSLLPTVQLLTSSEAFAKSRAEAVLSGCGSMEAIMSVVNTGYKQRLLAVVGSLKKATGKKPSLVKRVFLLNVLDDVKRKLREISITSISFYMLTVVPFLYTTVVIAATQASTALQSNLTVLSRSVQLLCHFSNIPGLVLGSGVLLLNKMVVYFEAKKSKKQLDDEIAKGAVTFFTVLEKMITLNPIAAAGISAMGLMQTGGSVILQYANNSVAKLSNNAEVNYMAELMKGIILFL